MDHLTRGWEPELADSDTLLRRFVLALMGHPPFMYRAPGGQAPPRPDGLEIRAVADQRTLDEFVTTLVEAYPMPGADRTVLRNPALLDAAVRLFVGYLDGRPVGTSGARLGHGLVDVEWVSARAEVRGRGVGAALTWAATLVEPDRRPCSSPATTASRSTSGWATSACCG